MQTSVASFGGPGSAACRLRPTCLQWELCPGAGSHLRSAVSGTAGSPPSCSLVEDYVVKTNHVTITLP